MTNEKDALPTRAAEKGERDDLIETMKRSMRRDGSTIDEWAEAILAAGYRRAPAVTQSAREVAFNLVDAERVPGGLIHDAVTLSGLADFVERIAAALTAASWGGHEK